MANELLWVTTCLILFGSKCSWRAQAEVYSSASDMKTVFGIETDLVDILDKYAKKLESKLERINNYMSEYNGLMEEKRSEDSDEEFMEKIIGNPIHAYKLMKRFSVDWKKIEEDLQGDEWAETQFSVRRKRLRSVFPRDEDLNGSAQSLIRLQDVYELDIRDLDCLFIGKHCFNNGVISRSLEWFEEAWILAGQEGNATLSQDQVQTFIDHAAQSHDERVLKGERGPGLFPQPVYVEPPLVQRQKLQEDLHQRLIENVTSPELVVDNQDDIPRFNALCRGEELRSGSYVATLKCHYSHQGNPYYYLHPVQIEVAHHKPLLRIFHNVLSTEEMAKIRDIAGPLLMRSQVQGKQAGSTKISDVRTSKTSWLQDSFDPLIKAMTKRVEWMTGLKTNTMKEESELLQMINLPHKGMFIGDRIATWMFYISHVPAGGRTVFPRLGASVEATGGSAVFWHNLHKSGEADKSTLHGACPIMFGTKWGSLVAYVNKRNDTKGDSGAIYKNGHVRLVKMKSRVFELILLGCLLRVQGEVFSSAGNMREIFALERNLLRTMESHIQKLEDNLREVDTYLKEFHQATSHIPDMAVGPSDLDLGNPISSFHTVKRLGIFYKKVEESLDQDLQDDFAKSVKRDRRRSIVLPEEEDLQGAAKGLLRIQDVYEIGVPDLSQGKIGQLVSQASLTAQDCLYIGKHCYNEKLLSHSLEWFHQARILAEQEGNRTLDVTTAQKYLDLTAEFHDEQFRSPWGLKQEVFPVPYYKDPNLVQQRKTLNQKRFEDTLNKTKSYVSKTGEIILKGAPSADVFNAMCRGTEFRTPAYLSKLYCYTSHQNDLYYLLQPARIEIAHLQPQILVFRDVVTPNDMDLLRDIAKPLLNNVGGGGRTVFPLIGAGIEPEAGSAVFWYNLNKNLTPDPDTLHGACPIMFGTKWGEVYSSSGGMDQVFGLERELLQIMDSQAEALEEKLKHINAYLKDFEEVVDMEDNSNETQPVVPALYSVQRLASTYQHLEADLEEDLYEHFATLDVYEIGVPELSQGKMGLKDAILNSGARLDAQDCLYIGKHCFNEKLLSNSLEWFQQARVLAEREGNQTLNVSVAQKYLDLASNFHDEQLNNPWGHADQLFPTSYAANPNVFQQRRHANEEKSKATRIRAQAKMASHENWLPELSREDDILKALCRGEEFRTPETLAQLHCYLSHQNDPYYRLHPAKVEIAHDRPRILVFRNIISQNEMNVIQDMARHTLQRAQVGARWLGGVSKDRISTSTWISDSHHPIGRRLADRVSHMTGLKTNSDLLDKEDAEHLQVGNYINGGLYHIHHDHCRAGKRTLLNDVGGGGRTVFPLVGAGISPEAGSAVFWYNLKKSLMPDDLTAHAACPLAFGTKWDHHTSLSSPPGKKVRWRPSRPHGRVAALTAPLVVRDPCRRSMSTIHVDDPCRRSMSTIHVDDPCRRSMSTIHVDDPCRRSMSTIHVDDPCRRSMSTIHVDDPCRRSMSTIHVDDPCRRSMSTIHVDDPCRRSMSTIQ
eukprot:snap_masked-scaffold103_size370364-processed-gene-2.2 protein:Tk07522 transcript:snap_masked-scaffold103_size370364-processed-gene-2.2-mRNA-1 annotation:"hypothetical protein DAPPUDRAFT_22132"